ncbi:MAG: N-acetylneuraminate synthase family protein [Candidatus Gastranaerophilales bacterium]|nr:N-acetylneuraminate synthase family protein [Candidatus Gastranaerophilales bacterium]
MRNLKIIAEFCGNHNGSIETVKKMIDSISNFSQNAKIDIIKFQKRCPKLILSKQLYDSSHPNPENSFGDTYGKHKEFLEFSIEEHFVIKKYCETKGFVYSTSVFDRQSLKEVLTLNPVMIKVSSANNLDFELLHYLDKNYNGEIHISLGMTTKEEEKEILKSFKYKKQNIILYACTSAYPVPIGDSALLEISRLKNEYSGQVKAIGFSGHHLGILQDIAAYALGAEYIERHFTLDKNMKGTDQKLSLNPEELENLALNLRIIQKDLCVKKTDILEVEKEVRSRLKQYVLQR